MPSLLPGCTLSYSASPLEKTGKTLSPDLTSRAILGSGSLTAPRRRGKCSTSGPFPTWASICPDSFITFPVGTPPSGSWRENLARSLRAAPPPAVPSLCLASEGARRKPQSPQLSCLALPKTGSRKYEAGLSGRDAVREEGEARGRRQRRLTPDLPSARRAQEGGRPGKWCPPGPPAGVSRGCGGQAAELGATAGAR